MYSNFITPPDLVETVLVVDATEEQIAECAKYCENAKQVYNVYFYHSGMDNPEWLTQVVAKADAVLVEVNSAVKLDNPQYFGPDEKLKGPIDFFNK